MFHPGILLLAWMAAVVGLQVLSPAPLASALAAMLLLGGAGARSRWCALARRSRWLLAVIALTFVLGTPGESVVPGYPLTHEGIALGFEQIMRFLAILGAVACLLDRLPTPQLIAGMLALSWPLARLGVDPRRMAARLVLVLEHIEHDRFADWRQALDERTAPPPRRIEIERPPLRAADAALAAATLAIVLFTVLA